MKSFDENFNYIGICCCYPAPGERHMFDDVIYEFKEYKRGKDRELILVFTRV